MTHDVGHPEQLPAWRLFCWNWLVLGLMAATLFLAMALGGFSLVPASLVKPVLVVGAYLGYAHYKSYWAHKRDSRVVFILGSTGQVLLVSILMTPMTYIAAATNFPMQDFTLNAIDHSLGLDWMGYFDFVYSHHALLVASVFAYSMIGWPVFGIPVVLGWTGRYRRLQQFTLAFAIALVVTIIVSIFTPAMGTYDFLKFMPDPNVYIPGAYLEQLRDLPLVRDGALRHIDFAELAGIVTFPSFHAAAAVLYLWAFWPVRWFGPIAIVANCAMLLATPIGGGHYFVDVFAGIAIAASSIMAAKWIGQWLIQPSRADADVYPSGYAAPAE
jgi:hypothetical protein